MSELFTFLSLSGYNMMESFPTEHFLYVEDVFIWTKFNKTV